MMRTHVIRWIGWPVLALLAVGSDRLMSIPRIRDLILGFVIIVAAPLAVYGWLLIARDIIHDRDPFEGPTP